MFQLINMIFEGKKVNANIFCLPNFSKYKIGHHDFMRSCDIFPPKAHRACSPCRVPAGHRVPLRGQSSTACRTHTSDVGKHVPTFPYQEGIRIRSSLKRELLYHIGQSYVSEAELRYEHLTALKGQNYQQSQAKLDPALGGEAGEREPLTSPQVTNLLHYPIRFYPKTSAR